MKFHLTLVSSNKKTGMIPVSTTSSDSCPDACPYRGGGCYAKTGHLGLHWKKVDEHRNISKSEFIKAIKKFPARQLWRHNQAGDLPHKNGLIDSDFCAEIARANLGKRGFTYTHHELNPHNKKMISILNLAGFTTNLSADGLDDAVKKKSENPRLPLCVVVPSDKTERKYTYKGFQFITCPATYAEDMSCAKCGICQNSNRKNIVAFPAHGTKKKTVDNIVKA